MDNHKNKDTELAGAPYDPYPVGPPPRTNTGGYSFQLLKQGQRIRVMSHVLGVSASLTSPQG